MDLTDPYSDPDPQHTDIRQYYSFTRIPFPVSGYTFHRTRFFIASSPDSRTETGFSLHCELFHGNILIVFYAKHSFTVSPNCSLDKYW